MALVCDDAYDDINNGDYWLAQVLPGTDLTDLENKSTNWVLAQAPIELTAWSPIDPSITSNWITSGSLNVPLAYEALAWLINDLDTNPGNQVIDSYAIWYIFDPSLYNSHGDPSVGGVDAVHQFNTALTDATPSLLSTLTVYNPISQIDSLTELTSEPSSSRPQQFGRVPESSSLPALALDLLALFGGIFLVRKREQA